MTKSKTKTKTKILFIINTNTSIPNEKKQAEVEKSSRFIFEDFIYPRLIIVSF